MIFDFNNESGLEFICPDELYGAIPEPTPMKKHVPDWYKKLNNFMPGRDSHGFKQMTAKRCLPMLDAMTLGWVVPLQADVQINTNDDLSVFRAETVNSSPWPIVERHSYDQVKSSKWTAYKQDPIKFINHWIIKTKPGWSCLIQAIPNELSNDFKCLTAVVDTDKYFNPINFPAIWLTPNADIYLKAGTPLVQVIPFKRGKDEAKVRCETKKEREKRAKLNTAQATRLSVYTKELREPR